MCDTLTKYLTQLQCKLLRLQALAMHGLIISTSFLSEIHAASNHISDHLCRHIEIVALDACSIRVATTRHEAQMLLLIL